MRILSNVNMSKSAPLEWRLQRYYIAQAKSRERSFFIYCHCPPKVKVCVIHVPQEVEPPGATTLGNEKCKTKDQCPLKNKSQYYSHTAGGRAGMLSLLLLPKLAHGIWQSRLFISLNQPTIPKRKIQRTAMKAFQHQLKCQLASPNSAEVRKLPLQEAARHYISIHSYCSAARSATAPAHPTCKQKRTKIKKASSM